MLWELVTNIVSGIGQVFSAKYYVTQQLAQMQAHNLNREKIKWKAKGRRSLPVIEKIFTRYDKLIKADEWAWIKKEGKIHAVKIKNKTVKDAKGEYHRCSKGMHYGVFPPTPTMEASLTECKWEIDLDKDYMDRLKVEMANFVETYTSNLEYWVLTLEALLQDMAI